MVAESGNLDAILFGSLKDGEIIIDLVGFIVDEDFYLLGREEGKRRIKLSQYWKLGQHDLKVIIYIDYALM
jgi:hypothetical protein